MVSTIIPFEHHRKIVSNYQLTVFEDLWQLDVVGCRKRTAGVYFEPNGNVPASQSVDDWAWGMHLLNITDADNGYI